ncbi:hypothetical protein BC938DRAFT_471608 [Jimgerdemannia flammicorona]|uniref:Uncharacterized protein n=1 Tax=Jimgerdemannia flammicorona TaxID=994334 RepID=A0A433Q7N2_9FUNG|nr:hypothetical protein BC938DRAFT_471608 [Jimgerdemannia flammicorona]
MAITGRPTIVRNLHSFCYITSNMAPNQWCSEVRRRRADSQRCSCKLVRLKAVYGYVACSHLPQSAEIVTRVSFHFTSSHRTYLHVLDVEVSETRA